MSRRHGISLIELLVTMSACTVILTMSAMLIHRIMHVQSRSQKFLHVERHAFRLSQSLRADGQRPAKLSTPPLPLAANALLRWEPLHGQAIEYRATAGNIQRVVLEGERVVAREDFVFPASTQFSATIENERLLVVKSAPAEQPNDVLKQQELPLYRTPLRLQIEVALPPPPATVAAPEMGREPS